MRIGICEFTTMRASFEEDLEAYAAAGVQGIGVCEFKLPLDGARLLRESGLRATTCIPEVPSILPLPPLEGPADPEVRVEALCRSVCRLAELEPECVMFLTGPGDQRDVVLEGVRRVAAAGEEAGVRVALEPVHPEQRDAFSFVNSIPDALKLLAEAGTPSVGLLVDVWHVGEGYAAAAGRTYGVHVADRREPTRNVFDRVLPGDGVLPLAERLRAIAETGYDGSYDVEIFSDESFPDSLWLEDPRALALRARESLECLL